METYSRPDASDRGDRGTVKCADYLFKLPLVSGQVLEKDNPATVPR